MTRRPCGACRELVPADSGCAHWKPGRIITNEGRKRDRNAEYARAARLRAQRNVAEFHRQMGVGT